MLYLVECYTSLRVHPIVHSYDQVFLFPSALIKVNKMYSTPSITLTAVALASSVALYVGANQQYVKSTY